MREEEREIERQEEEAQEEVGSSGRRLRYVVG